MPETTKEIGTNEGQNARTIRKEIIDISQGEAAKRGSSYQQKISRMEQKKKLTKKEKETIANALGVDVSDIEHFDRDKVMIKIFRDNNPTARDNAELMFGGESYKVVNPLEKVSELYERINKKDQYIIYLETLLDSKEIGYKDKKKEIFESK